MTRKPGPEHVRGRRGRRVNVREIRQRFLIVCEGEQTEPNYFRAFQTPGLVVKIEDSHARGSKLVAKAKQLRDEDDYDQVWCVFDRDDLQPHQIDAAFQCAQQEGISIAFSNQAFELWYLLHFDYHNTALSRKDYCERLAKRLGQAYRKNHASMYELLNCFAISSQPQSSTHADCSRSINLDAPHPTILRQPFMHWLKS